MIDNIWRDRIAMADVLVASAETSQLRFELILLAERLRRAARSTARDVFNAVTGRHRL
jgi:hypothetical protein